MEEASESASTVAAVRTLWSYLKRSGEGSGDNCTAGIAGPVSGFAVARIFAVSGVQEDVVDTSPLPLEEEASHNRPALDPC